MAIGELVFGSKEINRNVSFRFILPEDIFARDGENPNYKRPTKTLYLLHGKGNYNDEWLAGSMIRDFAYIYNLAIFMPSGEDSFYLNQRQAKRNYADYVGRELVDYTRNVFGLSCKREDTFVGGISMGGFGALHTGLAFPDTFGKIMALSSALIIHDIAEKKEDFEDGIGDYWYYRSVFGDLDTLLTSENNPEQLIRNLKEEKRTMPEIYMACGTEDFLLEKNREFAKFLKENEVPSEYHEGPGDHNFRFWNPFLEKAIQWMVK